MTSNGELLFAKGIVLGEGENRSTSFTYFQQHWGLTPVESGLSFVDAKGCGNYYPFVVLADAFKIPWYIFSDGEAKSPKRTQKLLERIYNEDKELAEQKNIFLIPDEKDFEGMLLDDGYKDEIEKAIEQLKGEGYIDKFIRENNHKPKKREKTSKVCESCHQNIFVDIERIYDNEDGRLTALDDIMEKNKAQLGPVLANCIIESGKTLPPLVIKLFDGIKRTYAMCKIKLSSKQQEIASLKDGAILVRASAGSGKTRVLVERIKMLVGMTKRKVLAITFTNKACEERLEQDLREVDENLLEHVFVATFHALCESIIESHRPPLQDL